MSIPATLYRGYKLRASSHQVFPPYSNPFAKGPARFSSIARIVTLPSSGKDARLYSTVFGAASPTSAGDALELAMQFGKDIVDGKVQAAAL
jgi:hypothetical protein